MHFPFNPPACMYLWILTFFATGTLLIIIIFMVTWTELDPPKLGENRSLDKNDRSIILVDPECRSDANAWEIGPYAWKAWFLIFCVFLLFQ